MGRPNLNASGTFCSCFGVSVPHAQFGSEKVVEKLKVRKGESVLLFVEAEASYPLSI